MNEENIIQEFRLKNTEETNNYSIKEINQNEQKYLQNLSVILNTDLFWLYWLLDVFQFLLLLLLFMFI